MKKVRLFCLALAALLCLAACEGAPAPTETAETPVEQTFETENWDYKIPEIKITTKKSDFEALSVANASMPNEELRRLIVDYYTMMANIRWTLSDDFTYSYPSAYGADNAGNMNLKKYLKYGGMPYTQASGGLADFLDFYDDETGVLDISARGGNTAEIIGNNCGTSVFWAWARVAGGISFVSTDTMTVKNGCLRVGPYTYDDSLDNFKGANSTRAICDANGEQKMYESYAQLLPGDGTVKYIDGADHHARLVREAAVVVRDSSGKIDGEKSMIVCCEQGSVPKKDTTEEDGTVYFITTRRSEYTFAALFKESSIPIRPAELAGTKEVAKAEVSVDADPDADLTALSKGNLHANYPVSRMNFTVKNAAGETVYESSVYSKQFASKYDFALNTLVRVSSVKRNMASGESYFASITVRLGNGETLTAWEGKLTI